jgi:hypothetical protein
MYFKPANDNARIEYDIDGSIIRVVPGQPSNPLLCRPHSVRRPAQTPQPPASTIRSTIAARQAIGNGWDGRRVLSWPTAERLLQRERFEDLRRLYLWRALVDLATLAPANDNIPTPCASDEEGDAAPEDVIDQADAQMLFRPTISAIKAAASWRGGDRPAVIATDRRGSLRKSVGGLMFDGDNRLVSFQTRLDGRTQKAKPEVLYRHRSERKPLPHHVSSAGLWNLDSHIEARDELRRLSELVGEDAYETLELACGPSTAKAIGETRGKTGKHAERVGLRLIDEALESLASLNCR